jgi:Fe-S cluster biosynthesis and repair protein YggX
MVKQDEHAGWVAKHELVTNEKYLTVIMVEALKLEEKEFEYFVHLCNKSSIPLLKTE